MKIFNCLTIYQLLAVSIVLLGVVDFCTGAEFDAKSEFVWVDSSCDGVIDQVNSAGDDYNALVTAALANLEGGSPSTKLGKATLLSYFGTDVGQLINLKYTQLQSPFKKSQLELYCDGTAFEWVTTYQEGPEVGQPVPKGGSWHAKEGRFNPAKGPLYLEGTKTAERTNICQTPEGGNAQGVSAISGKHIILCPDAFIETVHRTTPTSAQTIGTSLNDLTSIGGVLLHETTHCVLGTTDIPGGYQVNGVLMTAKFNSGNARTNADTLLYYAMASLSSKNAWVVGLAQALDNWGPKAPRAPPPPRKRNALLIGKPGLRAVAMKYPTTLITLPRYPLLEARSAAPGPTGTGKSTGDNSTKNTASDNQGPKPTVVIETSGTNKITQTFQATTYSDFTTLKSTLTTNIVEPGGTTVPVVIGPGGLGWHIPSVAPGVPKPVLPTIPPIGGGGGDGGRGGGGGGGEGGGEGKDPPESQTDPSASSNSKSKSSSSTKTSSSSSSSGVSYIIETEAIYTEVSDTIPYASVSAAVEAQLESASLDGAGATTTGLSMKPSSGGSQITGTSCAVSTTTYQTADASFGLTGVGTYCQCGPTIAGLNYAVSGTSTTSYCAIGITPPAGYTQIPADGHGPITPTTTAIPIDTASINSVASASSASSVAEASWSSAAAVPSAGCYITSDDGIDSSTFEVYGINDWAGDDGSKLFKQEEGCGILDPVRFLPDQQSEFNGRMRTTQTAQFGLEFFKGGCVERAIASAGGPSPKGGPYEIHCQHHGATVKGRSKFRRDVVNNDTLVEDI